MQFRLLPFVFKHSIGVSIFFICFCLLIFVFVYAAIGFNVETVQYNNIKFQVWDLGMSVCFLWSVFATCIIDFLLNWYQCGLLTAFLSLEPYVVLLLLICNKNHAHLCICTCMTLVDGMMRVPHVLMTRSMQFKQCIIWGKVLILPILPS